MTTENPTSIGFASDLIPLVLNKSKYFTYRVGPKYANLQTQSILDFYDSLDRKVYGQIQIVSVEKSNFSDLPIKRIGHEVYASKADQKSVFEKYYGIIHDNEPITVIKFRLI